MFASSANGVEALAKPKRNLAHLLWDMSLYEYMLGQLDITLFSGNHKIDQSILKNGLSRGQKLELLFASSETNCEVQLSFVVSAILPRRWKEIDIPANGQESFVLYFDNNRLVSMLRLRENIEHIYRTQVVLATNVSSSKLQTDLQDFLECCLSRLIILQPATPFQLALAIRSLPSLIKQYRPLGLVVVDSLNAFFLSDYDLRDDEAERRSSITIDPHANTFEIRRRGVATKKRKARTLQHSLFDICGFYLKKYWKEYKFPLIATKVETSSGLFADHRHKEELKETAEKTSTLIIDVNLKKIESEQVMVIGDNKSELFHQLKLNTGLKVDNCILLVSKSSENLEYDLLAVAPKNNSLYVELETLEQKRIKLV